MYVLIAEGVITTWIFYLWDGILFPLYQHSIRHYLFNSCAGLYGAFFPLYYPPLPILTHAQANHRFWRLKKALNLDNKTWISPLQKIALKFQKLDLSETEQIHPYAKAPWIPSVKVVISSAKPEAIRAAQEYKGEAGYTDASGRNDLIGIGVYWQHIYAPSISLTMSSMQRLNVYSGELAAIDASIFQLLQLARKQALPPNTTIFSDSLSALQALQNPGQQSGQSVLRSITYRVHEIETMLNGSYRIQIQWCPGHSKVVGNEIAHHLASQSTEMGRVIQGGKTTPPLLQAVALPLGFQLFPLSAYARPPNPKTGKFTKSIDKAPPPQKHTRLLYSGKSKYHASILCQLRTGICRLNRYLGTIGAADSTQCYCQRGAETVDHFLFRCLLWSEHRSEIRRLAGSRWGDTSYLLGGWSGPSKDGLFEKWKPNTEMINATIQFAVNTTRLNDKRGEGTSPSSTTKSPFSQLRPFMCYFRGSASIPPIFPHTTPPSILPIEWSSTLGITTTNWPSN